MSGETAAIGLGFLAAGPVGALAAGLVAPAAIAAVMYRRREPQHDANSNGNAGGNTRSDRSGSGSGRGGGTGNRGRNNGAGGGTGGGGKGPKGKGDGLGGGGKKPKTKDPVLDKLGRGLDKLKGNKGGKDLKGPKNKDPKAGGGKGKDGKGPKGLKDGLLDGAKKLKGDTKRAKDKVGRDKGSKGDAPWTSSPDGLDPKSKKDKKGRHRKGKGSGDDASSSTARDGLDPKTPKGGGDGSDVPPKPDHDPDEYVDAELVDDDLPPKPNGGPDDVIDVDGWEVDEDRITLVRAKREKAKRRKAIAAARRAAEKAARDGDLGDPHKVKKAAEREANRRIDLEIHHEDERLALATATRERRSKPVDYPAVQAAPVARRQAGAAMARQIDPRTSTAYRILVELADAVGRGIVNDDAADMGDHIVELAGIPNMCKDLSQAVLEAAEALRRTAPLHPSVIKHLNNAAVAARTAGAMADNIMIVFVQAHREDIFRVLEPRIGDERWNIRNAQGTLDGAKLRSAILSSQQRLSLPAGSGGSGGGSKLVPRGAGQTKKLIDLMKGFNRGHMVNVLSEVDGSAVGVEHVATSIGKLVRRMRKTWPTESVVDDTVARTEAQVRRVSSELKKAIRQAKKVHARDLRLNAKGRAGKGAAAERKWDVLTRKSSN